MNISALSSLFSVTSQKNHELALSLLITGVAEETAHQIFNNFQSYFLA